MSQILPLHRIRIHSGTATRDEAIAEAAALLAADGAVTAEYHQAMLDREATVSTAMGNLLAIPHGTNEAKDAIVSSAMSFVRYGSDIDWGGEPVRFVVGIAGVGDEHLDLLSAIAILFSEEDDVAALLTAETPEQLRDALGDVAS